MKNSSFLVISAFICIFFSSDLHSFQIPGYPKNNSIELTGRSFAEGRMVTNSIDQISQFSKQEPAIFSDENGKSLFIKKDNPQDSMETDALQEYSFNGFTAGDEFGTSVSSAGDVNADGYDDIIIGAPKNSAGGTYTGRAYIYFGGPVVNTGPDIILSGTTPNRAFGFSVSSAGDVNADGYDDVIIGDYVSSKAFIYYGGASMNNVSDITLTGTPSEAFGFSVSSSKDVNRDGFSDVIVGAYGASINSSNDGRAYIFFGGISMNNVADVTMTGEASNNYFGVSVSATGDVNGDGYGDVLVGAYGYLNNTGRAYIYFGGSGMNNTADIIISGAATGDWLGRSVSDAGDVNNDGFSDVIIGAPFHSVSLGEEGAAYIYYGGAGMNNTADVSIFGDGFQDLLGYSVSTAGDINGDGYSDVIAGAVDDDAGGTDAGRAYAYYGSASMNNVADAVFTGTGANDYFGIYVASAGDVNRDGYSDMIVGARDNDDGGINAGKAYLYTNTVNSTHTAMLTFTGNTNYEGLGNSVSDAGDVNGDGYGDIIIGSFNLGGSNGVYIYFGGNFMDNTADLLLPVSATAGTRVACAGDVNNDGFDDVVASNPAYNSNTGIAYIFYGGSNMNNGIDVTFTGEVNLDNFGFAISTAGDVNNDSFDDVIIGAPYNDAGAPGAGRAYLYYGGSSMDNIADVVITGTALDDNMGFSVSNAGKLNIDIYDDIIVGAPYDDAGGTNSGRAYIYYGSATMNNTADLILTGINAGDLFGWAAESAGDLNGDSYNDLLVSAIYANGFEGRTYIYSGGTLLDNIADVTLDGENYSQHFGGSVSTLGDINKDGYGDVIIGESLNSESGNQKGRVSIFYGGAVMNNVPDRIIYGENALDYFGYSVASAGDVDRDGINEFIVGAHGNEAGFLERGKVYLFKPSETGIDITDETFTGMPGDQLGYSVFAAGDVNGDGFSDLIAGSPYNNTNGNDAGSAYIYFGSTVLDYIPDVILNGAAANDHFGTSVAYAGDVNGDGYSDVIVGAPENDAAGTDAGRAYIYFGAAVMNNVADVILTGETAGDRFGFSVSTAGYANGDIYSEVIAGAPFNDAAGTNSGRSYIYFGGASMNNTADVVITGFGAGYWLGISCSYAGNVNGDFYDDVVVGASMHDVSLFNEGKALIFFGSPGMDNTADVILTGENFSDQFGYSVSAAGNINGDMYSDVIIGAYASDRGGIDAGRAYIYLGGAGMDNASDIIMTGAAPGDFFGVSVANIADVNNDSREDFIVGACYNDAGGTDAGRAYIFYGNSNLNNTPDVILTGKNPFDNFGWSVAYGGDFNGDYQSDILAGANFNDAGGTDAGKVYLFINSHPVEQLILTLRMMPQGFYNTVSEKLNSSDTFKVYLQNSVFPFNQYDYTKEVVNKLTFTARFFFRNASSGNYYVKVKHRNSIETWSAAPLTLIKNTNTDYDFTPVSFRSFASNMIQVDNSPQRFAFYGGDQDQNGNVNAVDVLAVYNDANNFITGYVQSDMTGDYIVDSSDLLLTYNNSAGFIVKITP